MHRYRRLAASRCARILTFYVGFSVQNAYANYPFPRDTTALTRLFNAVVRCDIDGIKSALDSGENVDQRDVFGRSALQLTLREQCQPDVRTTMAKLLVEQGARIAGDYVAAHSLAATCERTPPALVDLFLTSEIPTSPVITRCIVRPELMGVLEKHRDRFSPRDLSNALILAVATTNLTAVTALLRMGADAHAITEDGQRLVSLVDPRGLWRKSADTRAIIRQLVANGADPNAADPSGTTVLHRVPPAATIIALLALGANPNLIDSNHDSPLTKAMVGICSVRARALVGLEGQPAAAHKELLQGAEAEFRESDVRCKDVVQALLEGGANPNHRTREGASALWAVEQFGLSSVARLVRQANGAAYPPNPARPARSESEELAEERLIQTLRKGHGPSAKMIPKATANQRPGWYAEALRAAAFAGNDKVVRALVHRGASINGRSAFYSDSPLKAAAWWASESDQVSGAGRRRRTH